MEKALSALVFLGLLIASPGFALAESHSTGPHGGQIQSVGPYHIELVAKDGELRVYLTDHNNRELIEAKGSSGKANVIDKDGNRVRVQLEPVFGNLLRGSGDFEITPDTTVSLLVSVAAREGTRSARFDSLVAKAPAEPAEEEAKEGDDDHASDHSEEHATDSGNDGDTDDENGSSDSVY